MHWFYNSLMKRKCIRSYFASAACFVLGSPFFAFKRSSWERRPALACAHVCLGTVLIIRYYSEGSRVHVKTSRQLALDVPLHSPPPTFSCSFVSPHFSVRGARVGSRRTCETYVGSMPVNRGRPRPITGNGTDRGNGRWLLKELMEPTSAH